MNYILEGHTPRLVEDVMEWAKWFETADRRVCISVKDGVRISTVFLGIDHQWEDNGPPLLFETMIFGGDRDGYIERCSTWEQATHMHARMCFKVWGE